MKQNCGIRGALSGCGFKNIYTGESYFVLADNPSIADAEHFVDKLKLEILSQRERSESFAPSLAAQVQQLAKLLDDGLIDNEEFIKAKGRILDSIKTPGAIGFG